MYNLFNEKFYQCIKSIDTEFLIGQYHIEYRHGTIYLSYFNNFEDFFKCYKFIYSCVPDLLHKFDKYNNYRDAII